MITCYVGKYRRNIAIVKDDYHKMIIIISGSKVVDIKEEEIVHCMGEKKRVFRKEYPQIYLSSVCFTSSK